jgi:hypothetical protein
MTSTVSREAAFDTHALAGALRALGMLYGSSQSFEKTVSGAESEAEAIRAFIRLERPHLLSCYGLDELVNMVQAARAANVEAQGVVEQFSPR